LEGDQRKKLKRVLQVALGGKEKCSREKRAGQEARGSGQGYRIGKEKVKVQGDQVNYLPLGEELKSLTPSPP